MNLYDNKELYILMKEYYKDYYFNALKLDDWEERFIKNRINEEEKIGIKAIELLKLGNVVLDNQRVLVVGAGTGAELFYLEKNYKNLELYAIEPYSKAIEILELKSKFLNFPFKNIHQCFSEDLPFENGYFDLIICFTVLEHVNDVEKTILEMNRVLSNSGIIMIEAPNYLFPEEQHYKVSIFPPRISKKIARLNLKLYSKYTSFFETLNFFSSNDIDIILNKYNFEYDRKEEKYMKFTNFKSLFKYSHMYLYNWITSVNRNQLLFIKKNQL